VELFSKKGTEIFADLRAAVADCQIAAFEMFVLVFKEQV
jgi:hypothetical protein